MSNISVSTLDNFINHIISKNKKPEKILIGYVAYAELMEDSNFFNEVVGSDMNPNKRKYKGVRIKVTQDGYQLEVKHSN